MSLDWLADETLGYESERGANMTTRGNKRRDCARRALEKMTALSAVVLHLEGKEVIAAFELDVSEHERRSAADAGEVTSRALLHALWLLPAGIPVPTVAIAEPKRQHLRAAAHFAHENGKGFERLYSPAGSVNAIAIAGADTGRCVEHAIRFTPMVQRVVITDAPSKPSTATLDRAARWGVGVVTAWDDGCDVLSHPAPAVVGVPAVYRWWLAELAYESWLQQSAQPVS